MTRWIATCLLCACVAAALAVPPDRPSTATCEALAATVKAEGYGTKRGLLGTKHKICKENLKERKYAYCSCKLVPRKRELEQTEFLTLVKANSFLYGRGTSKRSLENECCTEGCYWEEIDEVC